MTNRICCTRVYGRNVALGNGVDKQNRDTRDLMPTRSTVMEASALDSPVIRVMELNWVQKGEVINEWTTECIMCQI